MKLISSSRWIGIASIDDAFPIKTRFFRFFAFSMSRRFRWSSGLSQFWHRKRFWICLRWFGKQLIWSNEMIKRLDVPPLTFPVLLYAGMYCQKIWVTPWIHRHEWLRKVEDQCFIMHILNIFRAGRTRNLIHQQPGRFCPSLYVQKWLDPRDCLVVDFAATRFSLLQALGAYVFFSSGAAETSLLAGSSSAVEGKTLLTNSAVVKLIFYRRHEGIGGCVKDKI